MPTKPATNRLSIQDTWEDATACVSDLEDCQTELQELIKRANVRSIHGLQEAVRHLQDAVDALMNKVPNGAG